MFLLFSVKCAGKSHYLLFYCLDLLCYLFVYTLISFWICRISLLYIYTDSASYQRSWNGANFYLSKRFKLSCFYMPNIYRFFFYLSLENINGSLNNPRLTLSPYGLRGAFLKSSWDVSVSWRKLCLRSSMFVLFCQFTFCLTKPTYCYYFMACLVVYVNFPFGRLICRSNGPYFSHDSHIVYFVRLW